MQWFTTARLSKHQELTPEGFLVVKDVPIARTGAQIYRDMELPDLVASDDGWISVDRDADEVFRTESIASFTAKPITNDHPNDEVNPDNWSDLAIGVVQNVRRGSGTNNDVLLGDLLFTTRRGISLVRSGKRALSVGYQANYDQTAPGRARQSNIIANHVALVEEGRCGTRCTIVDGAPWYNADVVWEENLHPRDQEGKFSTGGGHGTSISSGLPSGGFETGSYDDPKQSATFHKSSAVPDELNGVKFYSYAPPKSNKAWEIAASNAAPFDEPELPALKPGQHRGAGVIIQEPDGRVWIVHPTNEFGGYKATFPKGTVEPDMTARGTAVKEAYEESGLRVSLTGYAGDVDRDTSNARYYYAKRIAGTPVDHGWETAKVTLAPPEALKQHLNKQVDQKMVDDFITKAEAGAQPAAAASSGEIPKLSAMTKVGGKLGSNPGGQYKDASGKLHYVKLQKSNEHARNEILAARLYEAAGSPVLNTQPVEIADGKLGTMTEWKEKQNIDLNSATHRAAAQTHFATHAWLANWDAIGLGQHAADWNQAVIDGEMTTVDPGGSMLFRAQGEKKGDAFGNSVGEWHSLRDPKNQKAHQAFGAMTPEHLRASALKVAGVPNEKIKALVMEHGAGFPSEREALAAKLIARKRDLVKRALTGSSLTGDGWFDDIDYPVAA